METSVYGIDSFPIVAIEISLYLGTKTQFPDDESSFKEEMPKRAHSSSLPKSSKKIKCKLPIIDKETLFESEEHGAKNIIFNMKEILLIILSFYPVHTQSWVCTRWHSVLEQRTRCHCGIFFFKNDIIQVTKHKYCYIRKHDDMWWLYKYIDWSKWVALGNYPAYLFKKNFGGESVKLDHCYFLLCYYGNDLRNDCSKLYKSFKQISDISPFLGDAVENSKYCSQITSVSRIK